VSSSIRLSPKYGVNPSVMKCFYCGEECGVALPGLLKGDVEAPRSAVWDMNPCPKCEEWMKQGIILLGMDESKSDLKHMPEGAYRTGLFTVITEEAFKRIFRDEGENKPIEFGLKHRWMFIEDSVAKKIGLYPKDKGDQDGDGSGATV
jgi:hypothetical protein